MNILNVLCFVAFCRVGGGHKENQLLHYSYLVFLHILRVKPSKQNSVGQVFWHLTISSVSGLLPFLSCHNNCAGIIQHDDIFIALTYLEKRKRSLFKIKPSFSLARRCEMWFIVSRSQLSRMFSFYSWKAVYFHFFLFSDLTATTRKINNDLIVSIHLLIYGLIIYLFCSQKTKVLVVDKPRCQSCWRGQNLMS